MKFNIMRTQKIYRFLEIPLWVIAAMLLPVISIIPWIFRIRNLKKKNPGQSRLYMLLAIVSIQNIGTTENLNHKTIIPM